MKKRTHTHALAYTYTLNFWIEIKRNATAGYYARDLYQHEFMDEFKGTPCISHFRCLLLILCASVWNLWQSQTINSTHNVVNFISVKSLVECACMNEHIAFVCGIFGD